MAMKDIVKIGGREYEVTYEDDEHKKAFEEYNAMLSWAHSLTKEQIDFLLAGGWYNNTIKGYIVLAGEAIGLERKQISDMLEAMQFHILADYDKDAADKAYKEF